MDTQDIVQNALLHTLARIDLIQESHEGAFLGYLRRAAFREIIDVIRRVKRRPTPEELPDSQASRDPSPLEIAIGREGVRRYEAALAQLRPKEQAAIVGRLEMHYDYKELALLLGVPNANAARAAVTRATKRLLDLLQYER